MSIFEKSIAGFGVILRYHGNEHLYFERFEVRQMLKELSAFVSEWDSENEQGNPADGIKPESKLFKCPYCGTAFDDSDMAQSRR